MENNVKKSQPDPEKKYSSRVHPWYLKMGVLLVVLVLLLALIAGMHGGRREFAKKVDYGSGKMLNVRCETGGAGCKAISIGRGGIPANLKPGNMMYFNWNERGEEEQESRTSRIFGAITAIDGNKITVYDNGATDQPVLSLAETMIFSEGKEVGLKALSAGQDVVVNGTMNSENILEAVKITVQ